jgi:hypothetical protein
MSRLIHGPWRSKPIIGGLYRERSAPWRRVIVVGPSERAGYTVIEGDEGEFDVLTAALLDEDNRWHFMGTTAATPMFNE